VQHRAAHMGDRRSVRAAGENRNRRGAPSPSSEIGATPDLRQSGHAQRPAFCPAFRGSSERKRRRGRQPSLIQIPQHLKPCKNRCLTRAGCDHHMKIAATVAAFAGPVRLRPVDRRSTPCPRASPIAPRTSSLAVQTQRRKL
jgi:hypothetical protein